VCVAVRTKPFSDIDMLKHFVVPQLDVNNVIRQQDGAPPHYHRDVTRCLNQTFPGRWIGHGGYIPWPPRSPNLTSMDFPFWGFVKDNVYIPPMPVDLQELRDRIVNAIALVDVTFLNKLWDKLEYHLDVCRKTQAAILNTCKKLEVLTNAL
jgi:hypothetical protein